MVKAMAADPRGAAAGATPYLRLAAITVAGGLTGRGALAALAVAEPDSRFHSAKRATAGFFADAYLSAAPALAAQATAGADAVMALADDQF
jgi:hypothetical protein